MEILEILDILELNFKLKKHEVEFKEGQTISDYFPEYVDICLLKGMEEVSTDYIIRENDVISFTANVGGADGAKMALMAIFVIVIGIMTAGIGAAPAAAGGGGAGAAGGGGAIGAGAGGAAFNAANYAGTLYEAGAITASTGMASAGMSSGFLGNLALMAGSMVLNALLAPKAPSSDDMAPERSSYLWGDNKTQSKQMIPIPILLGKFPVNGNLVAARTEPKNHRSVFEPLYDTGFYEFGLCCNPLSNIEEVYLNKLKVTNMEDQDISVFHTKGAGNQRYLYALPDTSSTDPLATGNANVPEDIYRFNLLDNDPLVEGEAIIPGHRVETVLNVTLPEPQHAIYQAVIQSGGLMEFPETVDNELEFLGKCDSDGTLLTGDDINIEKGDTILGSFYVSIKLRDYELIEGPLGGTDKVFTPGLYEDTWPSIYNSSYIIFDNSIESYDWEVFNSQAFSPDQIAHVVYQKTVNTDEHIFLVNYYSANTGTITPNYQCFLAEEKEHVVESVDNFLDPYLIDHTDENWTTHTTSLNGIEDFKLELLAPHGLFTSFQHREDDLDIYGGWLTFAYEIKEVDTGDITRLTAYGHSLWNEVSSDVLSTIPYGSSNEFVNSPVLGISSKGLKQPMLFSVGATDILNHPYATGVDDITTTGMITLTDNKLTGTEYIIKFRVQNHGVAGRHYTERDPVYGSQFKTYAIVLPEEQQLKFSMAYEGQEQILNSLVLYRIKEFKYTENATYPNTSILGLVINATDTLNTNLPQLTVVGENNILVWDETIGTETDLAGHWDYTHSRNPAYICLTLLYEQYYGVGIGGYESSDTKIADFNKKVDVEAFCRFAEYCDEPIEILGLTGIADDPESILDGETWKPRRFTCNGVIDSTSTSIDWLNKILGTYDARIYFKGSQLSLIYDKQIDVFVPTQIFSSTNIISGSFSQSFANPNLLANVLETTFMDEDNFYEKTPIIYMPYDGTNINTNQKTNVNIFGITNKRRAIHRLHQILRKTNFLTTQIDFITSTSGFNLTLGTQIGVTYEYIEWGQIAPESVKTSGRIIGTDGVNKKVYLDKLIYQEDVTVNLSGYYIYLQSLAEDGTSYSGQIASNTVENNRTVLTLVSTFDDFEMYDIYLLGELETLYKDIIVNELSFDTDNLVKVKGVVYTSDIYDENYLITDISGSYFAPVDCVPNNLDAYYETGPNKIYITWSPPNIVSQLKYDSSLLKNISFKYDYSIKLEKYLVYRKKQALIDSTNSIEKWEKVGDTTLTSFTDNWNDENYTYVYMIVPVVKLNTYIVQIPKSWCEVEATTVEIHNSADYISKPIITKVRYIQSDFDTDYVDATIFIKNFANLHDTRTNLILVWSRYSNSASTDWYGPQDITLVDSITAFDQTIKVSSIDELPRDEGDNTKVKGLIILNDEEIIYVISSSPTGVGDEHNLVLYQHGADSIGRRYSLGTDQDSGVSVKNAHLGFYPIRFFGIHELNNIISSPADDTITFDSLFYYEVSSNEIKLVDSTDTDIVHGLKTINIEPDYWRIVSGYNDLISIPTSSGIVGSKIYISTPSKGVDIVDFGLNAAYKDVDKNLHPITTVALAPHTNLPNYVPVVQPYGADHSFFTIPKIPKTGNTWISLTHAETIEGTNKRGYTSYPVSVGE